ncbi:MAG: hypothetical protein K5910_05460 [Bacteroidales bacterium]|nr:hypothetical protein [Bacteroidales bacterium]
MERINTDFAGLEGTNCYCSAESAGQIRRAIANLPLGAFHEIGTGDYHYQTLFWLERIREPYVLVLFDHHPDDQDGAFGEELLSCGGWVSHARRLPLQAGDVWIRSEADFPALSAIPALPVYLSLDLDVLSPDWARTDWDQGEMSLPQMCAALRELCATHRVIGVDLCGGITVQKGASPEDLALNASTGEALYALFREMTT